MNISIELCNINQDGVWVILSSFLSSHSIPVIVEWFYGVTCP